MRTIAVINQKGGVGKTTTVANLGWQIAGLGQPTCVMDLDPQSHLTLHLGVEPGVNPHDSYELLVTETTASQAALQVAGNENLWLIPTRIDLAAAETELSDHEDRHLKLRRKIAGQNLPWRFLMIDCPPSLSLLTLNALGAADDVLIPLQPHFLALHGLGKLLNTILMVRQGINPTIRVAGIILCMYETGTKLAAEVVADLHEFLQASRNSDLPWAQAKVFGQVIRRNIKLAECPGHGQSIFQYDPHSAGAQDYSALTGQFLELFGTEK
ncbi:MAG: ParA family protein [Planctomycetes bacterium]|nr:ParA family protein [Planctomycetota bacterium]